MIDHSALARGIMLGSGYRMMCRVESWRGGQLLDGDIPIAAGTESVDTALTVPELLQLTVPAFDRGASYVPGADRDHPLASWGQRLRVSVGVSLRGGTFELLGRGWYLITDADKDGDGVTVSAAGLLTLIDEAKFISPYGPSGQISRVLRALVEPALPVDMTAAPVDRAVPDGLVWATERLDAVYELLDAWGATAHVTEDGILVVVPAGDPSVSSIDLTSDAGGTTMRWNAAVSRDDAANVVVARGYGDDGDDVQAVAYNLDPSSPTYYGGEFSPLPVPYVHTSPLLTTVDQCQTAAETVLARKVAIAARKITTTAVPYLALQARDGVRVTSEELRLDGAFGVIDTLTMPLTAADGPMGLTVRLP